MRSFLQNHNPPRKLQSLRVEVAAGLCPASTCFLERRGFHRMAPMGLIQSPKELEPPGSFAPRALRIPNGSDGIRTHDTQVSPKKVKAWCSNQLSYGASLLTAARRPQRSEESHSKSESEIVQNGPKILKEFLGPLEAPCLPQQSQPKIFPFNNFINSHLSFSP